MFRRLTALFCSVCLFCNTGVAFAEPIIAVDVQVTRAELMRMIVVSMYTEDTIASCFPKLSGSTYDLLFTDVSINDSFAHELCVAMRAGIVQGYTDGSFHPHRVVNFAEASKMITRALAIAPTYGTGTEAWYMPYARSLETMNAIPHSITRFDQPMKLSDLDEILERIEFGITDRPSRGIDDLGRRTEAYYRQ